MIHLYNMLTYGIISLSLSLYIYIYIYILSLSLSIYISIYLYLSLSLSIYIYIYVICIYIITGWREGDACAGCGASREARRRPGFFPSWGVAEFGARAVAWLVPRQWSRLSQDSRRCDISSRDEGTSAGTDMVLSGVARSVAMPQPRFYNGFAPCPPWALPCTDTASGGELEGKDSRKDGSGVCHPGITGCSAEREKSAKRH